MNKSKVAWMCLHVAMMVGVAVAFGATVVRTRTVAPIYSFEVVNGVNTLAFSPDGRWLSISHPQPVRMEAGRLVRDKGSITVYATENGRKQSEAKIDGEPWGQFFSPESRFIVAPSGRGTAVVAASIGVVDRTFPDISPFGGHFWMGRFITGPDKQGLRLLDTQEGTTRKLRAKGTNLSLPQFTANGKYVYATGSTGRAHFWETLSGDPVPAFAWAEHSRLEAISESPDGTIFAAATAAGMITFAPGTSNTGERLPESQPTGLDDVFELSFLDGGRFLIARGNVSAPPPQNVMPAFEVFDLSPKSRRPYRLLRHDDFGLPKFSQDGFGLFNGGVSAHPLRIALGPFGSLIRTGGRTRAAVVLTDLRTWRSYTLRGPDRADRVAFSEDGRFLAVARARPDDYGISDHQRRYGIPNYLRHHEITVYRMPRR